MTEPLHAAANRVATVATIHHRLYEAEASDHADAASYLESLVHDFRRLAPDRNISVSTDGVSLPSSRMSALGLIVAELITNAVKYGKGDVRLTLVRAGNELRLTVEDEGAGFPPDFPSPHGTGLGMQLIGSYSGFGRGAVEVDRSVPFSRITVRFRPS